MISTFGQTATVTGLKVTNIWTKVPQFCQSIYTSDQPKKHENTPAKHRDIQDKPLF